MILLADGISSEELVMKSIAGILGMKKIAMMQMT
jgi:hypothetical protein